MRVRINVRLLAESPLSLFHLLCFRPCRVDRLLMLRGIRPDGRHLLLRPREVDAAVAVEVVVLDVIDFVRHGVRRSDIDAPVREHYPDRLRRPGVPAERPLHLRRIVRRYRFIVRVRAQGDDMTLPADPACKGAVPQGAVFQRRHCRANSLHHCPQRYGRVRYCLQTAPRA